MVVCACDILGVCICACACVVVLYGMGDTIWIGQPIYTEGILKFGMENCKSLTTPIDPGLKLTKGTKDSEYAGETHY